MIVSLVERGLLAWQAEKREARRAEGKDQKQNPYITDAGKTCDRQIVLSLANTPETDPPDNASLLNFSFGGIAEEWFASLLATQGVEIVREARIEIPAGETSVSGRIDFLLLAAPYMVELKTTSSKSIGWLVRRGEQGQEAHRKQLNLYLHASQLGLIQAERDGALVTLAPFSQGQLVYVVKDAAKGSKNLFEFSIAYDEQQALEDLARLARLKEQADMGELPSIAGMDAKKFPCSYCSYRGFCFPEWRR